MNTDRDRLLKENEERIRSVKEELVQHHQAMLRCEDVLNVLAIERTNLESKPDEEQIEIPPPLQALITTDSKTNSRPIWPKAVLGVLVLAGILFGLGALGVFDNDGGASVSSRMVRTTPDVTAPSATKDSEAVVVPSSSIPPTIIVNSTTNANSIPNKINSIPHAASMSILPGITYTSEISYSMKCSAITLEEVQDSSQITLHVTHAPQSFFIPLKTPFRIDGEGMDTVGTLMVFANSKKHDLEIRFEPRSVPLERKILAGSSPQ